MTPENERDTICERQGQAAADEHRIYFIEEILVGSTLSLCHGDKAAARNMLQAAIDELELPQ